MKFERPTITSLIASLVIPTALSAAVPEKGRHESCDMTK
jgi:hypothetical protein